MKVSRRNFSGRTVAVETKTAVVGVHGVCLCVHLDKTRLMTAMMVDEMPTRLLASSFNAIPIVSAAFRVAAAVQLRIKCAQPSSKLRLTTRRMLPYHGANLRGDTGRRQRRRCTPAGRILCPAHGGFRMVGGGEANEGGQGGRDNLIEETTAGAWSRRAMRRKQKMHSKRSGRQRRKR